MEIEVFKKVSASAYEQLAVIDYFHSLVVNRRYYAANDFKLTVALSTENIANLSKQNAVRINGVFYYIDFSAVDDLESGQLTVSGNSFFGFLNNRIIWENYSKQGRPELIARDILLRHVVNPTNTARKINQITVASDATLTGATIQYQNSYGVVREEIEDLCETHDFGFKETAADPFVPGAHITFYKGADLSQSVVFTTDAENILSESYESADYDERNVALVTGEGEGIARTTVTVGSGSGMERKELYVDAKDLQSENDGVTLTALEYQNALIARGQSKLAEQQPVLILDGEINVNSTLYQYGVDYDVGDIVSRQSPAFGLSYSARITEMQEIYQNGLQIVPTFGKRSPTLLEIIRRK